MRRDNGLKKAVRSFAERHHLVALGSVGADDHHQPVKGFLLHPKAVDEEYATGHTHGTDVTLLVRTVVMPERAEPIKRLILEIATSVSYPHLVALGTTHEEHELKALLAGYHHYQRADVGAWRVFTDAQHIDSLHEVLPLLQQLATHNEINDIELEGRLIRIYIENIESQTTLDVLFRAVIEAGAPPDSD